MVRYTYRLRDGVLEPGQQLYVGGSHDGHVFGDATEDVQTVDEVTVEVRSPEDQQRADALMPYTDTVLDLYTEHMEDPAAPAGDAVAERKAEVAEAGTDLHLDANVLGDLSDAGADTGTEPDAPAETDVEPEEEPI